MIARDKSQASLLQVFKAVLWSFLGIRRRAEHEADAIRLRLPQVVAVGIMCAALFVFTLIFVVHLVITRATT